MTAATTRITTRWWWPLGLLLLVVVTSTYADVLVFSTVDPHRVEANFDDLPAKFGSIVPPEGIKGLVIYSEPSEACSDIKPPPADDPRAYGYSWIVLIARNNCSFEAKIRNAQKAGYSAAIVHNVHSNDLEPMSAKDPTNITIPSVFVSEFDGNLLKNVYSYSEDYFILINEMPININTHLLLPFAIVVAICFLVMVIFMIVRCIKDRRRARRHRLPNSSLKKIPTHKYTKGDPYETCAICLDDYVENEKLRVLPCAHAYHTKCIDPWLTKNRRVCPVCKRRVFAADERVDTDTESDSDVDDSTPLIRDGQRPQGTQGGTFDSQAFEAVANVDPAWERMRRERVLRALNLMTQSESWPPNQPSQSTANGGATGGDHQQQQQQQQQPSRSRHHRRRSDSESSYDSSLDRRHVDVTHTQVVNEACSSDSDVYEDTTESATATASRRFLGLVANSLNIPVEDLEKGSIDGDYDSTVRVSHVVNERQARNGSRDEGAINPLPTVVVMQPHDDNDIVV
ncbi:E3 ubiquitin-protein ligase RNF13 [Trichogramma pretiosum]|uniref:E3 ubiquitin-protein ligase RNF13 n=1 Tax=Trichogramma pretiosum TaxID=7493 RepID=UPI0006C9AE70|nr:E3 ubiquitin-protein ligase RNF13 [Trichogramma pretiosum]XP_023318177.1 E3 ubiquitin-protein ligase RNF13 [Trichogramma pretiosum]XP_023318178.1 E3 ubiquitin-protein ligase RNF13 [Trichogramma pretiosum]XP_023318179.1 E3 ubiquitin-protein ligase RNF13 [Trichogramma pretiosum]